ncbi:MAG TPA: carboxypeptidase-like regulatory domain-containing protein, partial [Bryobacteraceae bacterium]|nr:carboxypeptidase-like regulatory domain-containing protein [Bryobacteraceae bacterium]
MVGVLLAASCLSATEFHGFVKFGGLPMPGATVTATQGDKKVVTVTNGDGAYMFPDLADGTWTVTVDMQCFKPDKQDVAVAAG